MGHVRGSLVLIASGVSSALAVALLTPYLVDRLGVAGYGIWVVALALGGLFTLADVGLGAGVARLVAHARAREDRDAVAAVATTGLALRAVQAVVAVAIAWALAPVVAAQVVPAGGPEGEATTALRLAALGGAVLCISGIWNGVAIGHERFGTVAAIKLITPLGLVPAAVVVLESGGGVAELVAAQVALQCTTLAALGVAARHAAGGAVVNPRRISRSVVAELIEFGLPRQWNVAALIVGVQYERLMIGLLLGATAAGHYGPASALVTASATLLMQLVIPAMPRLTRIGATESRAALIGAYRRVVRGVSIGTAAVYGLLAATAVPLTHAWLGPGFGETARYVQVLAAAFALRILVEAGAAAAQAVRRPSTEGRAARVGLLVNLTTVPLVLAVFGEPAIALGTALALGAAALAFFTLLARGDDHGLARASFATVRPFALAAGLATAFAVGNWLALDADAMARSALAVVAAAEAVVFAVLYLVLLRRAGCVRREEIATVLRSLPLRARYSTG